MFGITPTESAVLALCLAGVVGAVIGRWTRLLSGREALLALAVAVVLPVVGSVISLTMVAMAYRQHQHQRHQTVSVSAA